MKELEGYLERLLQSYAQQPNQLRQAVDAYSESELREPLAEGEWTPHQVLAHVAAAEQNAFAVRLRAILDRERPRLENWDETRWMKEEYVRSQPIESMLSQFERERGQVIPRLRQLELEDWSQSGRHPHQGERTLLWWLEYAVQHTRDHLRQLGLEPA